jgi:Acyl-CoA carboxylase epsilon subunit
MSEAITDHEPHIKVLKGKPTEVELAALIAVLGSTGGGPVDTGRQEINPWGQPADKLRYAIFSWQRVTLLERSHMRR